MILCAKKKHRDILIIGGGAIGVCCAHYLVRSGRQVCLIEKGDIVGGVFYTQNAHLVPERFVLGLARHAEQNGAVIHTNTEVIGMKKSGRRITSVLTTHDHLI